MLPVSLNCPFLIVLWVFSKKIHGQKIKDKKKKNTHTHTKTMATTHHTENKRLNNMNHTEDEGDTRALREGRSTCSLRVNIDFSSFAVVGADCPSRW